LKTKRECKVAELWISHAIRHPRGKPTQPRAQQAERFLVFLKSLLARCQKLRSAELTLTL